MENSTTWFVFLGQRKTGVGAARRPTRVSVRRNPTRVHVCACVCVHTAVIVSLSWLVPRRGAEVSTTTKLQWSWCPQTPSRAPRRWHGERRGLPPNAYAEFWQPQLLLLLPAGSAQLAPGIHSRDWSRCAGCPQHPGQGPAPFPVPSSFLELCNLRDSALALGLRVFSSELVSVDAGQAENPPPVVFADPLHPSRQPLFPIPAPPPAAAAPAKPRGLCAGGRAAGCRGPTLYLPSHADGESILRARARC